MPRIEPHAAPLGGPQTGLLKQDEEVGDEKERDDAEELDPAQLDPRVDWTRMTPAAVERALGLRPGRCPQRQEFEEGRRDRAESQPPRPDAGLSYRAGYAVGLRKPRTSVRRPRLELVFPSEGRVRR